MSGVKQSGFTLIEVVIVLLVISILAGTIAPLASATVRAERIERVQSELEELTDALTAYYYENAAFPASLDATDFLGVHLSSGVDRGRIRDEWGGAFYRVSRSTNPDTWVIWSIGEDAVNSGSGSEDFVVTVSGSAAGDKRTRERLRIIAASLAEFIAGSGTLTGNWTTDRAAMGLGAEYQSDGYGTDFRIDASTRVVRSAGSDRQFSTADDLTT